MTEDDYDLMSLLSALVQAPVYQCGTDALILKLRQNRHRRKGQGRDGRGLSEDGQVAEKDVADDLSFLLGDQRHAEIAAFPQGIHEPRSVIPSKSEAIDAVDGFMIRGCF